jgi:hypothetical protein
MPRTRHNTRSINTLMNRAADGVTCGINTEQVTGEHTARRCIRDGTRWCHIILVGLNHLSHWKEKITVRKVTVQENNSPYLRTLSLYHLQQDHKPMLESNHCQWWRHLRREGSDNSINTHMTMGLSSVVSDNSTWTYGQLALSEGSTRTHQGMNIPKGWTSATHARMLDFG